MRPLARKLVAAAILAAAVTAVCLRIAFVNESAFRIPVRTVGMGRWLELDGAFHNVSIERTDGYSIRVERAEVMSEKGYLDVYGTDPNGAPADADTAESLIVLTLDVKNSSNTEGGIGLVDTKLIPARGDSAFLFDAGLWARSEPAFSGLEEGDQSINGITLLPDTSYTTHVPFAWNGAGGVPESLLAQGSPLDLVMSSSPVRNQIRVVL